MAFPLFLAFDTMCVINAHARSNRQMHGRIQCIRYYFCLLEETKEIALIVAVLSFDIKQILKKEETTTSEYL